MSDKNSKFFMKSVQDDNSKQKSKRRKRDFQLKEKLHKLDCLIKFRKKQVYNESSRRLLIIDLSLSASFCIDDLEIAMMMIIKF